MSSSIGSALTALPIEQLVAAPFVAAAQAQGQLSIITHDFIKTVGLVEDSGDYSAVTVEFTYSSQDASGLLTLSVPLLVIINVPSLSIKYTKVDFVMNIKNVETVETNSDTSLSVSAGWGWGKAKFKGSVSKATTRTTDSSARYSFVVEARDDGPPEGLSRVLDILSDSISTTQTA